MTIRPLAFIETLFHRQSANFANAGSGGSSVLHVHFAATATPHHIREFDRGLAAIRELPGGAAVLGALKAHEQATGRQPRIVLARDGGEPDIGHVSNGTWRVNPRALRDHPEKGLQALARLYEDLAQPRAGRFHGITPAFLPQPDAELQRTWHAWIQEGTGSEKRVGAFHAVWNWFTESTYYGGLGYDQMICVLDCIASGELVPMHLYAELNLSDLSLRELPEMPPNVHALRADDNKLTTLKNLPKKLRILRLNRALIPFGYPDLSRQLLRLPRKLIELQLDGNHLAERLHVTGIERWPLPKHLQILSLCRNALRSLPGLPDELTTLLASHNCLMDIRALGASMALQEADFSHNALDFVPAAIQQLPRFCRVNLSGNPLSIVAHHIAHRDNLVFSVTPWRLANELDRMNGPHIVYETDIREPIEVPAAAESAPTATDTTQLESEVRFWVGEAGMAAVAQLWRSVANKEGADSFARVLQKLRRESASRTDPGFRASMAEYLGEFIRPERAGLQDITFATCEERRARCVDHAALVWVQLKILLANDDVARGIYDSKPKALVELGEQLFILDTLTKQAIAKGKVLFKDVADPDRQEYVEAVLACYVHFREKLGLWLVVPKMNYEPSSRLTTAHFREIEATVRKQRTEEFPYFVNVEWEGWKNMLRRNCPHEYDAAQDRCYGALEHFERDITLALQRKGLDSGNDNLREQEGIALDREMRYAAIAPVTRAYLESMGEHELALRTAPSDAPATDEEHLIGPV